MIIAQSTHKLGFSTIMFDIGTKAASNIAFIEFSIGCFSDKFITKRNLIEYTIVEGGDKNIAGTPCLPMEILYCLVVPSNNGFIGSEFLVIPIPTQILAKSFVNTTNIGHARRALLTGDSQAGINFSKNLLVGFRIFIYLG